MVTTEKPERESRNMQGFLRPRLKIVTSLLPHCTGQRKSQDQPKLECAGTTKLSGKGYIEAINVIESIGAFNLTQDKRATFY